MNPTLRDVTPPTKSRLLIGFALRMVAALALIAVVEISGLADAGDRLLREQYYELRGQRATEQRVILVAVDTPTVAAWGAPPWTTERFAELIKTIERGTPAAVGVVDEPARLVTNGTMPAAVVVGTATLPVSRTSIDRIAVANLPAKLAAVAGAAGDGDITINFVGTRGLPIVSAVDVVAGKIPSATFTNKIVVLGFTHEAYTQSVATPLGPLAPAKVQAHALATLADGAQWATIPGWARWIAMSLLCALVMVLVHQLASAAAAFAATLGFVFVVVVADAALFITGSVLIGATLPVFATLIAAQVERVFERRRLRGHVREIAYWTRQWMSHDSMRADVEDEPSYWNRVGSLAQLYLGCRSTVVAELLPTSSLLEVRAIHGAKATDIAEPRRDVTRSPYRKAHVTLGPVWHDRFMVDGGATLLVPLVVRTNLIGFWVVTFDRREAVDNTKMTLIQTLADEIASAIDRRRTAAMLNGKASGVVGALFDRDPFSLDIGEVRRAFRTHTQHQQDLLALGESLPFGVFVATLWGEVRYKNSAMTELCKTEGLTGTDESLPAIMSRLTGFDTGEVDQCLRKLVQELEEIHVRGRDRVDRAGRDLVMSWLKPASGDRAGEQLILVCALPPRATMSMRAAPGVMVAPKYTPPDDHAATLLRPKVVLDNEDATVPRPLIEPDAAESPLSFLAKGTPTFHDPSTKIQLEALAMAPRPFVPDATLSQRARPAATPLPQPPAQPAPQPSDEIVYVPAGAGRTFRRLPVMVDAKQQEATPAHATRLMHKVTVD